MQGAFSAQFTGMDMPRLRMKLTQCGLWDWHGASVDNWTPLFWRQENSGRPA